jgi:hypothetical protein
MSVRAARLARAVLPAAAALVVAVQAPLRAGVALTEGRFDDSLRLLRRRRHDRRPDARYTGPALPEAVARGLQTALHLPADAPLDLLLLGNSLWRCMDGKVYACTFGANLPCSEKAVTGSEPAPALADFCRENSGAEAIPMAVTGRATVFEWRCANERPTIVRQFAEPDPAGYLANIWYPIAPSMP